MAVEWTTIGEVAQVFDGPHATPTKLDHGPYFLSISSLENGKLDLSKSAYISEEQFKKWTKRVTPEPGDVLFSYETRLGEAALMPEGIRACLGRRMGLLRPNRDKVDPRFLLFAYLGPAFQREIRTRTNYGATVERIALKELPNFPIELPELAEQERIAGILGALDAKVELNRQMNAALEAMAQALFKSWFVDFDPVIDNALAAGNPIPESLQARAEARKALGDQRNPLPEAIQNQFPNRFVFNDDLGWVPDGWNACPLADICVEITDGSHTSPKSVDASDGFPMASSKDLTPRGIDFSSCRYIGRGDFDQLVRNGCSPKKGDVLIAKDGSRCGETCCVYLSDRQVVLLSSVAILRPESLVYTNYIKVLLSRKSTVRNLRDNYVSGSAIPRIVLRDFKRYPILFPGEKLLQSWNERIEQLADRSVVLRKESLVLSSLRDTLLPKLLSGQLRVADPGKPAEPVVA